MAAARRAPKTTSPIGQTRSILPFPAEDGALAVRLVELGRATGESGLVHVAGSEGRAERLAQLVWVLAPDFETLLFPPWDCLPYDRVSPSPRAMGLRIAALSALAAPASRPRIVFATAEALQQRVPPRSLWDAVSYRVAVGDDLDLAALAAGLRRIGYRDDERVDEAGEFAVRGNVIDVFPAGYYLPVRMEHEDGRVVAIASYDAASQRTTDAFEVLALRPVSEAVLPEPESDEAEGEPGLRPPGLEHRLPELLPELETFFDYVPAATFVFEPRAEDRRTAFLEQVRDAHETRTRLPGAGPRPLDPGRLYLDEDEHLSRLAAHRVVDLIRPDHSPEAVPSFARDSRPGRALAAFVRREIEARRRLVVASAHPSDLARLSRAVASAAERDAVEARDWADILEGRPGEVRSLPLAIERGFILPDRGITVIAAADLLGSRAGAGASAASAATPLLGEEEFRIGDAVIHLQHGMGLLEGLEAVDAGAAGVTDTIRLEYAGGAKLMAPVADIELIWRYGAVGPGASLDRLDGESWPKRRAKVEAEINKAAADLATLAEERRARKVPKIVSPSREYERFVARFPFTETADQKTAVDAILADLASGTAMDRLVCGDVGFGKTEVALRAAAAVALAGRQVAIAAPTTVLVRQHLETFRRRFADFGVEVGHLSRLVKAKEARDTKDGLASGRIRVAIGTHALAGKGVAFADLALLIVDEEQRFGAADKAKLRALGAHVHVLTMTATPIPRTMQSALVGIQDVSVLSTPPAERQPVRTFVMPLDEGTVRESLMRERKRNGQSFVVCPQIEDIEPMADRLRKLVPELSVSVAHGKIPAGELDDTMVRFADGEGDVLLATNIIESGLDVPRANTILIWRADRFGLAQLHQLRGRVGRGRARGIAYLLTDPEIDLPEATRKRLASLETLDRLGAGFAISTEDLEQRGAGDLLGETQTGHVKLIGSGLYRRLLEGALEAARGLAPAEEWTPEVHIGASGLIPADYVPEPEVRLNLYARIARASGPGAEAALEDEIADRFGPLPRPVLELIALTRLRRLCREAGVARLDAGPQAIALTFKDRGPDDRALECAVAESSGELAWQGRRLILRRAIARDDERLDAAEALLANLRRG